MVTVEIMTEIFVTVARAMWAVAPQMARLDSGFLARSWERSPTRGW
jgi:hypothetical protein